MRAWAVTGSSALTGNTSFCSMARSSFACNPSSFDFREKAFVGSHSPFLSRNAVLSACQRLYDVQRYVFFQPSLQVATSPQLWQSGLRTGAGQQPVVNLHPEQPRSMRQVTIPAGSKAMKRYL